MIPHNTPFGAGNLPPQGFPPLHPEPPQSYSGFPTPFGGFASGSQRFSPPINPSNIQPATSSSVEAMNSFLVGL